MKTSHTPGPWQITGGDGRSEGYVRSLRRMPGAAHGIAVARINSTGLPVDEVAANARLIAAAPDLLRSLKATLDAFKECVGADGWREFEQNNAAVICAQGALIEAEGRA